jgi:hypothetical protein
MSNNSAKSSVRRWRVLRARTLRIDKYCEWQGREAA